MNEKNVDKQIKKLEEQIGNLISLRKEKIAKNLKNSSKIWNILKRKNTDEKEIERLEEEISRLSRKLSLLRAKVSKPFGDLRSEIKNELKAYIIQKILNKAESTIIFNDINTIVNEIMDEISLGGKISNNSEIKESIKNEMLGKLKENFDFIEDKNISTLEAFKN